MDDQQRSLFLKNSSRTSPPQGALLSYGTAGFRADASLLESTVYRMGILAALRSLKTGSLIGVMITDSHNKISDNGVKVADPSGGMLTQGWEPFANALANAPDSQTLLQVIEAFVNMVDIPLGEDKKPKFCSEEIQGLVESLSLRLQN